VVVGDRGRRQGEREAIGGKEGEITQTLYAHMNKRNLLKRTFLL
jgi:hypothetical protein